MPYPANFVGFINASRFASQGMRYSRTRLADTVDVFIFSSIPAIVMAKLEGVLMFVAKIITAPSRTK